MHFWVSAARVSCVCLLSPTLSSRGGEGEETLSGGIAPGHLETSAARCPRKMGTNWFMPALVKRRLGASGSRLDEGTVVWPLDLKKSRNDWRIWALVMC